MYQNPPEGSEQGRSMLQRMNLFVLFRPRIQSNKLQLPSESFLERICTSLKSCIVLTSSYLSHKQDSRRAAHHVRTVNPKIECSLAKHLCERECSSQTDGQPCRLRLASEMVRFENRMLEPVAELHIKKRDSGKSAEVFGAMPCFSFHSLLVGTVI